jgi:hypothetical protein
VRQRKRLGATDFNWAKRHIGSKSRTIDVKEAAREELARGPPTQTSVQYASKNMGKQRNSGVNDKQIISHNDYLERFYRKNGSPEHDKETHLSSENFRNDTLSQSFQFDLKRALNARNAKSPVQVSGTKS